MLTQIADPELSSSSSSRSSHLSQEAKTISHILGRSEPSSPPVQQSGWMMTGCLVLVFSSVPRRTIHLGQHSQGRFSHGWKSAKKGGLEKGIGQGFWYEIGLHQFSHLPFHLTHGWRFGDFFFFQAVRSKDILWFTMYAMWWCETLYLHGHIEEVFFSWQNFLFVAPFVTSVS